MEAFFLHLAQIGCAKEIVVFLSSMFPIWELKGAIILGQAWGLSPWVSYALSLAGSSLSAVILLLFLRPVIRWMYKTRALCRFAAFGNIIGLINKKTAQIENESGLRTIGY